MLFACIHVSIRVLEPAFATDIIPIFVYFLQNRLVNPARWYSSRLNQSVAEVTGCGRFIDLALRFETTTDVK
eukprot:COSAG02_NODE_66509_length_255_cov_0.666667_1_plen_71_part_10